LDLALHINGIVNCNLSIHIHEKPTSVWQEKRK